MEAITNTQKYENYKEQMGRLNRAIKAHFYLEALFIEYAIIEDRTESILIHSGKSVNPKATLTQKVNAIQKLLEKDELLSRYIKTETLTKIRNWKDQRNTLIHSLMKHVVTTKGLEELVSEGHEIVKTLRSGTTSYKRALERQNKKEAKEQ